MGTSIFIAKIFGLIYLIIGIGVLLNRKFYQQVMDDLCKNAAYIYYGGLFALLAGILIILTHNIWTTDWTVIITILGWIALVKGIWIIVFPQRVAKVMQAYRDNENLLLVNITFAFLLGAVLTYFGFFAG